MAEPKGDKLFVNLPASQVHRRLKGFGHGVRKIQSAGRNQSVIIHTAKGHHLYELQKQFEDVGSSINEKELGDAIATLRNLGPTSAAWLIEVGIKNVADLKRVGPADAYKLVKRRFPNASLNLLWSMAAAVADRDWRELVESEKDQLLKQIAED